jgi:hypothetical protein
MDLISFTRWCLIYWLFDLIQRESSSFNGAQATHIANHETIFHLFFIFKKLISFFFDCKETRISYILLESLLDYQQILYLLERLYV